MTTAMCKDNDWSVYAFSNYSVVHGEPTECIFCWVQGMPINTKALSKASLNILSADDAFIKISAYDERVR